MINIYSDRKKQSERLVEKTVNFVAPIKKTNLLSFYESQSKKQTKKRTKTASQTYAKEVSRSHKSFEIARIHGITTCKILEFDMFETKILFDEQDYAKKPRKHELVNLLED